MRALFRIAFAATGIAFCGLVGFYGYHRFGEISPLPLTTSESDGLYRGTIRQRELCGVRVPQNSQ